MSAGNVLVWICWVAAAAGCLGSALAVVLLRNALFAALALIGNLVSLAVFYLLLSAEFVAAAQVLIYAGAVMVMFLFVIAYVGWNLDVAWTGGPSWQTLGGIVAAAALLAELVVVIALKASNQLAHVKHVSRSFGDPSSIGRLFMSDHLLAFEVISIVLLVAAIGGVILGAQRRRARNGGAA
ncbi:MAG: NADH-quinone oxidoreductase subunit J [Gaiellaceae bacterium]